MFSKRRAKTTLALMGALWAAAFAGCASDDAPAEDPSAIGDPEIGPQRLSETGLYSDFGARTIAPNVVRFAPAHPLWADEAEKTRFLYLPPGAKIDTRDMDRWVFPVGTKVWKEFRVEGKVVETRLLWKRRVEPGVESWWKTAYVWEPDGSDAIATTEAVPNVLSTTHDVPSQQDCTYCHLYVRDTVIGFSAMELSSLPSGPSAVAVPTEDTGLLLAFAKQGLFTDPPSADFVVPGTGVARDALAYLHGNCGFCHNERMEELIQRRIKFRLSTQDTIAEQTGPYTTTFRTKMKHILEGSDEAIVPGDPAKSQVYVRMIDTNRFLRMPPRATKVIDPIGSALVRDWILTLPP